MPVKPLPKTGLPRLDQPSWDKGFADGFRGETSTVGFPQAVETAQRERSIGLPSFQCEPPFTIWG